MLRHKKYHIFCEAKTYIYMILNEILITAKNIRQNKMHLTEGREDGRRHRKTDKGIKGQRDAMASESGKTQKQSARLDDTKARQRQCHRRQLGRPDDERPDMSTRPDGRTPHEQQERQPAQRQCTDGRTAIRSQHARKDEATTNRRKDTPGRRTSPIPRGKDSHRTEQHSKTLRRHEETNHQARHQAFL